MGEKPAAIPAMGLADEAPAQGGAPGGQGEATGGGDVAVTTGSLGWLEKIVDSGLRDKREIQQQLLEEKIVQYSQQQQHVTSKPICFYNRAQDKEHRKNEDPFISNSFQLASLEHLNGENMHSVSIPPPLHHNAFNSGNTGGGGGGGGAGGRRGRDSMAAAALEYKERINAYKTRDAYAELEKLPLAWRNSPASVTVSLLQVWIPVAGVMRTDVAPFVIVAAMNDPVARKLLQYREASKKSFSSSSSASSLIARVFERGTVEWSPAVKRYQDNEFGRKADAAACGVTYTLAIPIITATEKHPVAVVEIIRCAPLPSSSSPPFPFHYRKDMGVMAKILLENNLRAVLWSYKRLAYDNGLKPSTLGKLPQLLLHASQLSSLQEIADEIVEARRSNDVDGKGDGGGVRLAQWWLWVPGNSGILITDGMPFALAKSKRQAPSPTRRGGGGGGPSTSKESSKPPPSAPKNGGNSLPRRNSLLDKLKRQHNLQRQQLACQHPLEAYRQVSEDVALSIGQGPTGNAIVDWSEPKVIIEELEEEAEEEEGLLSYIFFFLQIIWWPDVHKQPQSALLTAHAAAEVGVQSIAAIAFGLGEAKVVLEVVVEGEEQGKSIQAMAKLARRQIKNVYRAEEEEKEGKQEGEELEEKEGKANDDGTAMMKETTEAVAPKEEEEGGREVRGEDSSPLFTEEEANGDHIVRVSSDSIILSADLPGVKAEEVVLSLDNSANLLHIQGQRGKRDAVIMGGGGGIGSKRSYPSRVSGDHVQPLAKRSKFSKTISLPRLPSLRGGRMECEIDGFHLQDGVLTVKVVRAEEDKMAMANPSSAKVGEDERGYGRNGEEEKEKEKEEEQGRKGKEEAKEEGKEGGDGMSMFTRIGSLSSRTTTTTCPEEGSKKDGKDTSACVTARNLRR